jgi:hypothetical protein
MKATRPLFLFIFSIIMASCFDSPEFSKTPKIEFRNLYFGYGATPSQLDSLVVELSFEDGDGDLGLDDSYRNFPYHEFDLFLGDGNVKTATVRNFYSAPTAILPVLDVPDGATGKLVRYGDLPGLPPDNCENFKDLDLIVSKSDDDIFDSTYTFKDEGEYYVVSGKFHVELNKYANNIFVRFYRNPTPNNPDGWYEYKWPFCPNFDGRFTVLSDEATPLSGTMRYTMSSYGFASEMGNPEELWKLSFTIVDQARRGYNPDNDAEDNTVFSPPFTLNEITR